MPRKQQEQQLDKLLEQIQQAMADQKKKEQKPKKKAVPDLTPEDRAAMFRIEKTKFRPTPPPPKTRQTKKQQQKQWTLDQLLQQTDLSKFKVKS